MQARPLILIVDDEPFNVDYLEQELADLGYATLSARNGQEALEQVAHHQPDLVLLDIMMPVMDGFDVLERLHADDVLRHLPVIIISATDDIASTIRGIELGAEDYLLKPIEPALLEARIRSSLEKKRLRDAEQRAMRLMERDLHIGRTIQAEFLPQTLPPIPGWEVMSFFQAARDVAGDFYDVFDVPSVGRMAFVLGDVSDKGVGAALYMALFRSLLRTALCYDSLVGTQKEQSDPAQLLGDAVTFLNRYVATVHEPSAMFITLFVALVDTQTGEAVYVNAGHDAPLVVRQNAIHRELTKTGMLIGIFEEATYAVEHIRIEQGDRLLIYSDGVPDTRNADGAFFGKDALYDISTMGQPLEHFVEAVQHALEVFQGEAYQHDDITMLVIDRL